MAHCVAMNTFTRRNLVVLLLMLWSVFPAASADLGKVELLRDRWGVPHIFAESDAGAMYGLGYFTAQERGFQMTYALRIMQGRSAEILGSRQKAGGRSSALESDKRMRTFGWSRAASRIATNLDHETKSLLQAYCDGVNASFQKQQQSGTLHPLFKDLSVSPEPWTPADCLLSWWHLAQFFATDGTRDLMVWRNNRNPAPGQLRAPEMVKSWADDTTAVVQLGDASKTWLEGVERFTAANGFQRTGTISTNDAPKFSHAWVVGGKKSTTGSATLVSDPQTPVRNPSLWMEFHLKGKTFDVRGIGVPGSPGLLIGFSKNIAWGLTALGADQADLFRLETSAGRTNEYRWNGAWRTMTVRTETIAVKGGDSVPITLRETHLGPVVSEFAFRQSGDPEVALKRVPNCETNRDTIQSVFALMRAKDASEVEASLTGWQFPSANCVYGDSKGRIGFSVVGAIPLRSASSTDRGGGEALAGTGDKDDWQGFVPGHLLPRVEDPAQGFLLSANHRPVGAFYKIPLGTSTGSLGDTIRSWRLRERLTARDRFSPSDVLDVHYDTINPARREMVRLALQMRKTQPDSLSQKSLETLAELEKWLSAGASSDLKSTNAELATRLSTFFRFVSTPLALEHGGGESGLARFLKSASARMATNSNVRFSKEECEFLDRVLSEAGTSTPSAAGRGRESASQTTRNGGLPRLGWFDSLDGFGTLDQQRDLAVPDITCLDGQTIHCQSAQSYTQWVPLHDVDSAQSLCPIGHSDRPESRFRTSTMELWGSAKLHPAPLSRSAVEGITAERTTLLP